MIFDQLDALRWLNRSTSTALDVCKEMLRQVAYINARENGHISCIFSIRAIDFETDPGLQNLLLQEGQKKEELLNWSTVTVNLLSESRLQELLGKDVYNALSLRLRRLLQTPAYLYIWSRLIDSSKNSIQDLQQLMEMWWDEVEQHCIDNTLSNEQITCCRDEIVATMQQKERLSLPIGLFNHRIIDRFVSNGVLNLENSSISFLHQSFYDFFLVNKQLNAIYHENKLLPMLLPPPDQQTPHLHYLLLMILQYLCDSDLTEFLAQSRALLESNQV